MNSEEKSEKSKISQDNYRNISKKNHSSGAK